MIPGWPAIFWYRFYISKEISKIYKTITKLWINTYSEFQNMFQTNLCKNKSYKSSHIYPKQILYDYFCNMSTLASMYRKWTSEGVGNSTFFLEVREKILHVKKFANMLWYWAPLRNLFFLIFKGTSQILLYNI